MIRFLKQELRLFTFRQIMIMKQHILIKYMKRYNHWDSKTWENRFCTRFFMANKHL